MNTKSFALVIALIICNAASAQLYIDTPTIDIRFTKADIQNVTHSSLVGSSLVFSGSDNKNNKKLYIYNGREFNIANAYENEGQEQTLYESDYGFPTPWTSDGKNIYYAGSSNDMYGRSYIYKWDGQSKPQKILGDEHMYAQPTGLQYHKGKLYFSAIINSYSERNSSILEYDIATGQVTDILQKHLKKTGYLSGKVLELNNKLYFTANLPLSDPEGEFVLIEYDPVGKKMAIIDGNSILSITDPIVYGTKLYYLRQPNKKYNYNELTYLISYDGSNFKKISSIAKSIETVSRHAGTQMIIPLKNKIFYVGQLYSGRNKRFTLAYHDTATLSGGTIPANNTSIHENLALLLSDKQYIYYRDSTFLIRHDGWYVDTIQHFNINPTSMFTYDNRNYVCGTHLPDNNKRVMRISDKLVPFIPSYEIRDSSIIPLSEFNIYPQPANNHINVAFRCNGHEYVGIRILDINGKEIINIQPQKYSQGNVVKPIAIEQLKMGTYFILVTNGKKMLTLKQFLKL